MAALEIRKPSGQARPFTFPSTPYALFRNSFFGRQKRKVVNPLSTVILTPLVSAPNPRRFTLNNFEATVFATFGVCVLFVVTYLLGISMAKSGRLTF